MDANNFITSIAGVRVPRMLYGTAWKKARTEACVQAALQEGFRGIDTACQPKHYYEAGVGAGVVASLNAGLQRADLYLQTKFTPLTGQDPHQVPYDPHASLTEQVAQSLQASLRNLQTAYIDCLVLHSPLSSARDMLEVWQAMQAIVDAGGTKQIGISNCYDPEYFAELLRTARIKPAVIQNRFYADTGYDREIRALCRQHGIIYQSFWTLTANPQVLAEPKIKLLAANYTRTPAQILFRYLTQSGVVPLTGTTSTAHMREDLAIFTFELTETERAALDQLF